MERAIFLEQYIPSVEEIGGEIISLDPVVSHRLSKKNIVYTILENYYDENDLREGEDIYFSSQMDWFNKFDLFLKDNISFCREYNLPLAKANYLRMKYFIDTVVINCFILSNFFKKKKNLSEILYVPKSSDGNNDLSIFNFTLSNRWLFGQLLELFCRKNGVRFKYASNYRTKTSSKSPSHVKPIKRNHYKDFLKIFFNALKFNKSKKFFKTNKGMKGLKLFFMHAGSPDIDIPIKEGLNHSADVYIKDKERIVREDSLMRKTVFIKDLEEDSRRVLEEECEKCVKNLKEDSTVISWINDKCHIDVAHIVLPFLKCFILKDIPLIIINAINMFDFYRSEGIDYVFARGNTDRDSVGALIAAKYMGGAGSICIQHASFSVNSPVFSVFETETYDFIFTRDDISQSFYENARLAWTKGDAACRAVELSHYLKDFAKKYNKRQKIHSRETIVYVEKKINDRLKCYGNMVYSICMYFEFQKKVIDFFAKKEKPLFLYKHANISSQRWAEESILEYIDNLGCGNVKVFNQPFSLSLEHADRVIVDYPSGALYEAAVCRKPVLCIYPDYLEIIDEAKEIFGKTLRSFSGEEEAIEIIDEFLSSDPEEYIVDLPLSNNTFVDVLNQLRSCSPK